MKIALVFFSPTGNTGEIAAIVKKTLIELDIKLDVFDITNYSDRQIYFDIRQYDAFVFGFPIYAWRAPKLIREWLQTLDGKGIKCAVFFTYGGVSSGVAHYNIKQILEKQNFQLVITAEFLGKHTYNLGGWNLMEDRPNESDFIVARSFTKLMLDRFASKKRFTLDFEKPTITEKMLDRLERTAYKAIEPPSRKGVECSLCYTCENSCPTMAMNAEKGEPDAEKCIRCLKCIANCPDEVLVMGDLTRQFEFIKKVEKLTEDVLNSRISKIFE